MNNLDILCNLPSFAPLQRAMGVNYFTFSSLSELISLALQLKQKEDEENCIYFFRGEGACFLEPLASLFTPGVLPKCENKYYQAALSSAPDYFYSLQTTFDRLSQMRHYSFPTRILDISENVLTAWFMALDSWVIDKRDRLCKFPQIQSKDEAFPCPRVIVFRIPKNCVKEAESDLVTNLSCLAKVDDTFTIGHLWHEIQQERSDFHEGAFWENFKDLFTNWCVRPRMTNPRIWDQQGAYILFGLSQEALNGLPINGVYTRELQLHKSKGRFAKLKVASEVRGEMANEIQCYAYLMPSQASFHFHGTMENIVWSARRELEYVGIASHTMYRDNIEKHSEHWREVIKRRYSNQ